MSDSIQVKAFVAGATGYTGREVVRQLRERGIATVAHLRPGSRSARTWTDEFRAWGAEVREVAWDREALEQVLREVRPTVVFSLIGTTRARARQDHVEGGDIYDSVDYALTARLVQAAAALDPQPRFVYLSSIGAREHARSRYLAARGRAERDLVSSGLPYTVARPSFISGSGRDEARPVERGTAALTDSVLAVAGLLGARRTRDRYRSIDNVGLARALVEAGLDAGYAGATLDGIALHALAER